MLYIACPASHATGGTELLHQFGQEVNAQGVAARMCYYDHGGDSQRSPVAARFEKYSVPYVTQVKSVGWRDTLLVPEVMTGLLYRGILPRFCRRAIWWLSVDNYFDRLPRLPKTVFLGFKERYFRLDDARSGITHFAQSCYALEFLRAKRIGNLHYLSDCLGDDFPATIEPQAHRREDLIAYNPTKGWPVTERIIEHCSPTLRFVGLSNMTPQQMRSTLAKAKVYIDFGHHPGKDRIPREAAISGCCVLTNREGAAGNARDIPIPEAYKFSDPLKQLPLIASTLASCVNDYARRIREFEPYVTVIAGERARFSAEVGQALRQLHLRPAHPKKAWPLT
jgi:hypothetical protein